MTATLAVGTDGSENSVGALKWALKEAAAHGSTVELIYSWDFPPIIDPMGVAMLPAADEMTASAHKLLDEVVKQAGGAGVVKVTYKIVRGAPASALLDASKRVDLLVIGRRGHGGFLGLLLGSVAQQVVHHAECPVVVVPA